MNPEDGNFIDINPQRCKGCAACVVACPNDCIEIGSEINQMGYQYARFAVRKCIACGICAKTCPVGALEILGQ